MNNGKVAVVSGGSRGLGKAIVQTLLDEDYKVAAFSRSESDFINTLRESEKYRGRFYWEAADAADACRHETVCSSSIPQVFQNRRLGQ
nr:SDR family NAD(P)-dependent oxidoreductase [Bacillus velezensis]